MSPQVRVFLCHENEGEASLFRTPPFLCLGLEDGMTHPWSGGTSDWIVWKQ